MDEIVTKHLNYFKIERNNKKISMYIMSNIIPVDSFKINYIMSGKDVFSENIQNHARIINSILPDSLPECPVLYVGDAEDRKSNLF